MNVLAHSYALYKAQGGGYDKDMYMYILTRKINKNVYNKIVSKNRLNVEEIEQAINYTLFFATQEDLVGIQSIKMTDEIQNTFNLLNKNFKGE